VLTSGRRSSRRLAKIRFGTQKATTDGKQLLETIGAAQAPN